MIVASICLVALGSRWVSGPMVAVVVLVLLLVLGGVCGLAVTGRPAERRFIPPYGPLNPYPQFTFAATHDRSRVVIGVAGKIARKTIKP